MTTIETFAARYGLTVKTKEQSGQRFGLIYGRDGWIGESMTASLLRAEILCVGTWERMKKEFTLSYNHVQVGPGCLDRPSSRPLNSLSAEFSPEDDRQSRAVIKAVGLA